MFRRKAEPARSGEVQHLRIADNLADNEGEITASHPFLQREQGILGLFGQNMDHPALQIGRHSRAIGIAAAPCRSTFLHPQYRALIVGRSGSGRPALVPGSRAHGIQCQRQRHSRPCSLVPAGKDLAMQGAGRSGAPLPDDPVRIRPLIGRQGRQMREIARQAGAQPGKRVMVRCGFGRIFHKGIDSFVPIMFPSFRIGNLPFHSFAASTPQHRNDQIRLHAHSPCTRNIRPIRPFMNKRKRSNRMQYGQGDPEELKNKFWHALADSPFVFLERNDAPDAAVVMTAQLDKNADHSIWFFSHKDSDLAKMGRAVATFAGKGHEIFARIEGTLTEELSRERLEQHWSNTVEAWYKGGKDDPNLLMLRMDLGEAEIWSTKLGALTAAKMKLGMDVREEGAEHHAKTSLR